MALILIFDQCGLALNVIALYLRNINWILKYSNLLFFRTQPFFLEATDINWLIDIHIHQRFWLSTKIIQFSFNWLAWQRVNIIHAHIKLFPIQHQRIVINDATVTMVNVHWLNIYKSVYYITFDFDFEFKPWMMVYQEDPWHLFWHLLSDKIQISNEPISPLRLMSSHFHVQCNSH